jgi:hypothetical protein
MITGVDMSGTDSRRPGRSFATKQRDNRVPRMPSKCRINAEIPFTFVPSPGKSEL